MAEKQPHPEIIVIGSVNMDLVVRAPRIPAPGETILGGRFETIPGGKGANQAVAAARLGGQVAFVGRVGDDAFGRKLRAGLKAAGVDCRFLKTTPKTASGVALIVVSEAGENAICVAGGANTQLTPEDLEAAEPLLAAFTGGVCLLQLEIPLPTAQRALEMASTYGLETVLDPAPAPAQAPPELWKADILTPNQGEAAQLLATPATEAKDPRGAAAALRQRGAKTVVLKLGDQGAYLLNKEYSLPLPGHRVSVVDTTAAGDAFTAALAVARAAGKSLPEAVRFANAAGALACTRFGAQPSLPTRTEVEALLAASTCGCETRIADVP